MTTLELLDKQRERYSGERYTVRVYYSPPSPTQTYPTRYVTTSMKNRSIDSVSDTERLDPSSILPWRDPEPKSKEQQVESVKRRQETLIDRFCDRREKARA